MQSSMVDKNKVELPKITFTSRAINQLEIIINNDFTLIGKYLRLLISGKGCDGFTYSVGFTDLHEEDLIIELNNHPDIQIIMDPFTAFYLQDATVDFVQDFTQDAEGFVVVNHKQESYSGKFWKDDDTKVPPTLNH